MDDIEYALKQGWISELPNGNYKIIKDENSPVWQYHVKEVDDTLWTLYEKGLIYPTIRDDGETAWSLTEKGKQYAEQNL